MKNIFAIKELSEMEGLIKKTQRECGIYSVIIAGELIMTGLFVAGYLKEKSIQRKLNSDLKKKGLA